MKVAVLACGPSLVRHYTQREAFDLVIAVNTAGWLYAHDWLAFSDKHIVVEVKQHETHWPRVGLLTNKAWKSVADQMGRQWVPLPLYHRQLGHLTPDMLAVCAEGAVTECAYTFPNALWFARQRGATDVHVYGFDCDPRPEDVAGVKGYHTRKRWLTELPWIRACWDAASFVPHCEAAPAVLDYVSGRSPRGVLSQLIP